jgi:hypothetical protein
MSVLIAPSVLIFALVLVWIGYHLALNNFRYDRECLAEQRQALEAEWQALENTRRVRSVFLRARRAMQDQARQAQAGMSPPSSLPSVGLDDEGLL